MSRKKVRETSKWLAEKGIAAFKLDALLALCETKSCTFGVGKELNTKGWQAFLRQLIALGYLVLDNKDQLSLYLISAGRAVLKGEQSIHMRLSP